MQFHVNNIQIIALFLMVYVHTTQLYDKIIMTIVGPQEQLLPNNNILKFYTENTLIIRSYIINDAESRALVAKS